MNITLKLFATLSVHLPPEARRSHQAAVEVQAGATVLGVIEAFRVPPALCTLVLVNGTYVAPEALAGKVLAEGDVLAIWPPVGGG
ncbi:MoaD/ThiS family protein [Geothrix sp. 21YS21S-2]|uniref:MoaD/ThiS family protein n=1 Tax=Geothrix sp. 21YS21S-2 TaxID=3068893 RepID=UPI0027B98BA4|nr:MoaD/ThiS family protein [Geothrix sp. 21YS21S-2]